MRIRSKVVLGAVVTIFGTGAILLLGYEQRQLIGAPYFTMLVIVAALMVIAAVLVVWSWHDDWQAVLGGFAGIAFVGTVVFAFGMFGYIAAINAWLDDSTPHQHRVKVLDIGKKRGSSRPVAVESWRVAGERARLRVDDDLLERRPTHLILTTRDGFLGIEWVVRVEAAR